MPLTATKSDLHDDGQENRASLERPTRADGLPADPDNAGPGAGPTRGPPRDRRKSFSSRLPLRVRTTIIEHSDFRHERHARAKLTLVSYFTSNRP